MAEAPLQLSDISHTYWQGKRALEILRGIDLQIAEGEIVALVGPSGSGKSTLLHIAGLMEKPTGGSVILAGQDSALFKDHQASHFRRAWIGFVYQRHYLLSEFSALENVMLPQLLLGKRPGEAKSRARSLLEDCGLGERLDHRPMELSGGEQQRVAIARALANRPRIFLADEPTGNLDPKTAHRVFSLMCEQVRQRGAVGLIATHNMELAALADRTLGL